MICLINVSKYYNSGNTVALGLRKINLEFDIGEFVAITGESGSGKSTLLNVISGLDTYDDGEIYVDGETTSHYDNTDWENYRKNKIGFVFQNYNLIDSYTVLENVQTSLLIQGYSKKESYEKALKIIETVDLQDRIKNRASQLSSGQKQRLSIARALAKDADIIIADEPTGNLDKENGKQIIELLHKISKYKLVIMVTHNYEEVAQYATRKIRMYDGEVASDEKVNNTHAIDKKIEHPKTNIEKKASDKKISLEFAKMNIKSQPKKGLILFVFLLFTAISSFIFLGSFISNLDDTSTKIFDEKAFLNGDNTRVVVRKSDNTPLTQEDLDYFSTIDKVVGESNYDLVCDMNYFYRKNIDYKIVYDSLAENQPSNEENKYVVLTNYKNFIRPISTNKNLTLSEGKMPEAYNEIVLYSTDKDMLGKTIEFYFSCKKKWSIDTYIEREMKVVGLLSEKTNQVYFSESFCRSLYLSAYGYNSAFVYYENVLGDYQRPSRCIITENYDLKDNQVSISSAYVKKRGLPKNDNLLLICLQKDDEMVLRDEFDDYVYTILTEYNSSTETVYEISHENFEEIYKNIESYQAVIYIEDYAYMDNIINELAEKDYVASSPFRIGSTNYSQEKVRARIVTLSISLISLFIVFLLEILIVRSLLKYKKSDFIILKLIGMTDKTVKFINYYELFIYNALSIIASIIVIMLLYSANISYIVNIVKYYNFIYYLIFILLNSLAVYILSKSYNRYLSSKFNITSLVEY